MYFGFSPKTTELSLLLVEVGIVALKVYLVFRQSG
jgi:hypothetical protein